MSAWCCRVGLLACLMNQALEQLMDSEESGGVQHYGCEKGGEGQHCGRCQVRISRPRLGTRVQEPVNAGREILAVGEQRSRQTRNLRGGAQARHPNQGCSERERTAAVAIHGAIVGGPFGEPGPGLLQPIEAAEKREQAGGQKNCQTLQIVVRNTVCVLMAQDGSQLTAGKRAHHRLRDHQARSNNSGKREQRRGTTDNPHWP
jgi:hypothetical protein